MYYIDTCIWIDLFEDRKGFGGEPLGEYAQLLFEMVINTEGRVIISDILKDELKRKLEEQEIQALFSNLLIKDTKCSDSILVRASEISKRRRIPLGDAIHALIAREQNAILVTRDNHFDSLRDICIIAKPEQLIRVS